MVHVEYTACYATQWSCTDAPCTGLVKLGGYGESRDGSPDLLHSDASREDGSLFTYRKELRRHVAGATCMRKGIADQEKSAVDGLGDHLCYEVSNPIPFKHFRRAGQVRKVFICPKIR